MLYRRFGRTELNMPVFSTGGMRYQDGWKDKPLSEVDPRSHANLHATIERSLEVGIHHIETARGYGCSERELGMILPHYPRESLIVQTKVGPSEDPKVFEANFHDSLRRLNLDYVDLLAIHGLNAEEPLNHSLKPGGCLDVCRKLRDQGKCRFIGFSTHGEPGAILRAIEHDQARPGDYLPGDGGFDYLNLHWYYILQRNWSCIEAARARDMGVFIISPTDKGGHLHTPAPKLRELTAPLHPIVFNDLWCLNQQLPDDHPTHPGDFAIHTLSLGAAKPGDYDEHLEAVARWEDRGELLTPIVERLEAAMNEATGYASPEYGLGEDEVPEVWQVPGHFNVRLMLWLHNLARGWGLQGYGQARYNLMGNAGHWFAGRKTEDFRALGEAERLAIAEACKHSRLATTPAAFLDLLDRSADLLGGGKVKRLSAS